MVVEARDFALAVSGGGDSVALMHLVSGWLKQAGAELPPRTVLTVDHGLRPGSKAAAKRVAQWTRAAGFEPQILSWRGTKPTTGMEEKAREARYRLIGDWCCDHGVAKILVAHTEDDQAETFLLRLGRGSGVDGLSAMRARSRYPLEEYPKLELVRPLLGVSRRALRAFLTARGADWLEDPMNRDPRFQRARVRELLPSLEQAGLSVTRIAQAARHLARAREALDSDTSAFLARYSRFREDAIFVDAGALLRAPREVGLRALSSALMRLSGATYRPRFERLEKLYDALSSDSFSGRTLLGCRIGKAAKGNAEFGPATLEIRQEEPRKGRARGLKSVMVGKGKLPKKGRIIAVSYNS